MQTINEIKQEISPIFEPIIGTIRLKTYFSYYAVFKDGLMIALYQNKTFYLRISKADIEKIINQIDTYNLSDNKIGLQSKKFYYIPDNLIQDINFLSHLINSTIDELNKERYNLSKRRATQIRTLPNMNLKLERMLKKVGISSIQEFIEAGYISTFIKLVIYGFDPTDELLFKLNGAINYQYIYTFTPQQKRELLQEANQALYEIGFRKRLYI